MIRFSCPQCGKALKVPAEQARRSVVCPRCGERSVVPASATGGREVERPAPTQYFEQAPGLFGGMSSRLRRAVALVAGADAVCLVLAFLSPLLPVPRGISETAGYWAVPLAVVFTVLLLALLHGHATGCPACGKWWSRKEVEERLMGREVFAKGNIPFERALSQTTYECSDCGHRWSVTNAEEYPEPARGRPQRHRG